MWKFLIVVGILFSVCSFSACDVSELSTLRELSRPYLGTYDCERLVVGGEERREDFRSLSLELGYDGGFALSYRMHGGREGRLEGSYTADPERGELTLSAEGAERVFRMEQGAIVLDGNLSGTLVYAVFRLP